MRLMIEVPGGTIAAEDTGGTGTPIVLLHAGWADASSWDEVVARLTPTYRVIRYDARGYGASPTPGAPFTDVGDLSTVLSQLDVGPAIAVGHSGGGGLALGLAVAEPDRFTTLVLLAPGVPGYPWPEAAFQPEMERLFEAGDVEGLVALGGRIWAAADPGGEAEPQIRGAVLAFLARGDFVQPDPPVYDRLDEVRIPTTLMLGDLDQPIVAGCCRAIAERISGCRWIDVPGADHMLPLRVPDLIVKTVMAE